ncbi:MAG: tetratricopeptide repeat protein, partial [Candidatus Thiodiazotropha sp. 6PLUC10]
MKRLCLLTILLLQISISQADWFLNHEQQAAENYKQGHYDEAAEGFEDAYRRGVAHYRTGDYESAIKDFKLAERDEVKLDARYNQGNSHYRLEEYEQAVDAYESVLELDPEHEDARHNLALAKDKLAEQQEEEEQEQDQE